MGMKEILSITADIASVLVALLAIIVSVKTYTHGLKRECRMETIRSLRSIRMKYFNTKDLDDKEKLHYLNELEYFATGINSEIYDIMLVNKMSGRRLIRQYEDWCKDFIEQRRKKIRGEKCYCEYESMINMLKNMKKYK